MANGGIIRRPAVPSPVRIRRDVTRLDPNDPILTFYERAVDKMQALDMNNSSSWRYQAAIHDYPPETVVDADQRKNFPNAADPLAKPTDKLPSAAERKKFWGQCQHHGWFFLSWHRAYLHFFEKIVASFVAKMPGGPTDWALPYWNYTASADAAKLPKAFRDATIPDLDNPGKTKRNHLFVVERVAGANSGGDFLTTDDTNLDCVKVEPFGNSGSSFGGAQISHHSFIGGGPEGALEGTPHDAVHGALGQSGGFMGGFVTAPLDPIFWLHHCNVDRVWEIWVQRQKQRGVLRRNPNPVVDTVAADKTSDQQWLDLVFDFHDENGNAVTMKSSDVVNTKIPPLSYEYEDISDPFKGAA
jgi:tyrosinase